MIYEEFESLPIGTVLVYGSSKQFVEIKISSVETITVGDDYYMDGCKVGEIYDYGEFKLLVENLRIAPKWMSKLLLNFTFKSK